jgi:hypothetical protein
MPLGQQVTEDPGVIGKRRRVDRVQFNGAFHVAELPDVLLQPANGSPAQHRVTDRPQSLLVLHDPLFLMGMSRRVAMDDAG